MKPYFTINNMWIRPYSPDSVLAINYYAPNEFDERTHFLAFPSYENLAVLLKIYLSNPDEMGTAGTHVNLRIELVDNLTQTMLVATSFKVHFSEWLSSQQPRIDMPLDIERIDTNHEYVVRVLYGQEVMIERKIRFYPPHLISSDTITIDQMYFCDDLFGDGDEKYRSIVRNDLCGTTLVMRYTLDNYPYLPAPEISIKLYSSHYDEFTLACKPRQLDHDGTKRTYEVRFAISEDMISELLFVSPMMLKSPLNGVVSMVTETPVPGVFEGKDFVSTQSCSIEWGEEYVREHLKTQQPEVVAARERLSQLVGLDSVKAKVKEYESLARFYVMRKKLGLSDSIPPLHSMFLGSPGTGKTTVAKIIGHLLHDAGVLSKGHVVIRERSTLLGKYYNTESEKTLEAIEEAQGGVLFIDEAYQLFQPQDDRDPGRFVIDTLLTTLADESKRDWMLILAGYTAPMQRMFEMNPGLKSRIPSSNFYYFEDYNVDQLYSIADSYISLNNYQLTPDAGAALKRLLQNDYDHRTDNFGNARHVVNIIQTDIVPSMAMRLADLPTPSRDQLTTITIDDIPRPLVIDAPARRPRIGFVA